MAILSSLYIHHFRSYESLQLPLGSERMIVLYGDNGAGKTNILEAVSLLTPGRGLRGTKPLEAQNAGISLHGGLSCKPYGAWSISAKIRGSYGEDQIGVGIDARTEKKIVRINNDAVSSQAALAEYLACVWMTPQMDRLFLDAARERRKFFDRLVFTFDPGHAGRLTRYENAMRQRSKLLSEAQAAGRSADSVWISGLEKQMIEAGTAIAAARIDYMQRLQQACERGVQGHFPLARVALDGALERLLLTTSALDAEDSFAAQLQVSRARDAIVGGAAQGPHKTDLLVTYEEKQMPAAQCSTGEQKALLIGIILAHAQLLAAEKGRVPVILLDEVAAHLDEGRRAVLFDILHDIGAQVWMTGTERALFDAIDGRGQYLEVRNGAVAPCAQVIDLSQKRAG